MIACTSRYAERGNVRISVLLLHEAMSITRATRLAVLGTFEAVTAKA